MKTVKELRDFLIDLPDDMPIATYVDNMERHGYMPKVIPRVVNMELVRVETYDRFDYIPYSYERFMVTDNGGTPVLVLD